MPLQRSGLSWWSSRNVWTSRQTWGSSCCRTFRTSSGRSQRLRWNTPGTLRSWPNDSWQRLGAPRTTNNTSKHLLMKPTWLSLAWRHFDNSEFWHFDTGFIILPFYPVYGKSRHCQITWSCGGNKNKICVCPLCPHISPTVCLKLQWPYQLCVPVCIIDRLQYGCGFASSDVPSAHFIHNLNTWQAPRSLFFQ